MIKFLDDNNDEKEDEDSENEQYCYPAAASAPVVLSKSLSACADTNSSNDILY